MHNAVFALVFALSLLGGYIAAGEKVSAAMAIITPMLFVCGLIVLWLATCLYFFWRDGSL